jgi:dolichol-phosphate mannosyltransferase
MQGQARLGNAKQHGAAASATLAMMDAPVTQRTAPELSVVIPTYNESGNVETLLDRLTKALAGVHWEIIFVDDNSADGTSATVRALAQHEPRVRCIRRIGRRGLSSACIEGMLASSAKYVAVMDADLQHDPASLPPMLATLRGGAADIVVGSRYTGGGSIGEFGKQRLALSRIATRLATLVARQPLADPMSGYFMLRREVFESLAPKLSGMGFKILLDIVATARPPLRLLEQPIVFGQRFAGESKLTASVGWEFILLLADKLFGRVIPPRFLSFAFVGGLGVLVHFTILAALLGSEKLGFVHAQATATGVAMVFNYAINNVLTYMDRPRRGWRWLTGLVSFALICSVGALSNVGVAAYLFERDSRWQIAALAGILVGAVWNFAVSNVYTWRRR